jgi:hypothetical protein
VWVCVEIYIIFWWLTEGDASLARCSFLLSRQQGKNNDRGLKTGGDSGMQTGGAAREARCE